MSELLTYSRIKQRKNCPMCEHIRYDLCLAPILTKQSLGIGRAVHKGLETYSIYEAIKEFDEIYPSNQKEQNTLEINKVMIKAMLTGYFDKFEKWTSDFYPEIQFKIPIINPETQAKSKSFKLAGKVDGLVKIDTEWWIVEYKTATQINDGYFEKLELDDQITTYIYAIQKLKNIKIAGVIYRVIRKPTIRQKQNESIIQYCDRLEQDYKDRPEFYFYEYQYLQGQAVT